MLNGISRRALRALQELCAPAPPAGYSSIRLDVPEFVAMRLMHELRATRAAAEEMEQLREENFELAELARRQAARIEELEQENEFLEQVHGERAGAVPVVRF